MSSQRLGHLSAVKLRFENLAAGELQSHGCFCEKTKVGFK